MLAAATGAAAAATNRRGKRKAEAGAARCRCGDLHRPERAGVAGGEDATGEALRILAGAAFATPVELELLGALEPVPTVATNYAVYPFVGLIAGPGTWTPSASEVDEVIELRLADVRAARTRRRLHHRGIPFRTDVYDVGEQLVIWGATARIVSDLLARILPVLDDAARA